MYRAWTPALPASGLGVNSNQASSGGHEYGWYTDSGEIQAADRMQLEGMYQTGRRFSLAGWSADEWGKFFESVAGSASQVYATVANRPIATQPVPVVATPIGGVPTWAIVGLVAVGGFLLLSSRRR